MMLPIWLVCVFVTLLNAAIVDWPADKQIITPVNQRKGHFYLIPVDYKATAKKFEYAGVAVLVDVDDITFGMFPTSHLFKKINEDKCVLFQTGRGPVEECATYFLLVADRYKFERKQWQNGFDKCKMVQFLYSVAVLIKYDVNNENSPKYIGTYSKTMDRLTYTNEKGLRIYISNFKRRIDAGMYSPDRYEVLCATAKN